MNLDQLTIKEAREIAAMFSGVAVNQEQQPPQSMAVMPLLVTTAHKGVFFGYGTPTTGKTIRLEKARMCVYWPSELHGVLGLAMKGPNKGSRVGPAVKAITITDVTSVAEVSEEAVKGWEAEPWN
jgi:hypothetical protein